MHIRQSSQKRPADITQPLEIRHRLSPSTLPVKRPAPQCTPPTEPLTKHHKCIARANLAANDIPHSPHLTSCILLPLNSNIDPLLRTIERDTIPDLLPNNRGRRHTPHACSRLLEFAVARWGPANQPIRSLSAFLNLWCAFPASPHRQRREERKERGGWSPGKCARPVEQQLAR
jgi:hypothetical protein